MRRGKNRSVYLADDTYEKIRIMAEANYRSKSQQVAADTNKSWKEFVREHPERGKEDVP